jgi:hypothetical protein
LNDEQKQAAHDCYGRDVFDSKGDDFQSRNGGGRGLQDPCAIFRGSVAAFLAISLMEFEAAFDAAGWCGFALRPGNFFEGSFHGNGKVIELRPPSDLYPLRWKGFRKGFQIGKLPSLPGILCDALDLS